VLTPVPWSSYSGLDPENIQQVIFAFQYPGIITAPLIFGWFIGYLSSHGIIFYVHKAVADVLIFVDNPASEPSLPNMADCLVPFVEVLRVCHVEIVHKAR
jgi:hypothetical protein